MIPLKAKLKGQFLGQLQSRIDKWASRTIAARIVVPDSLKWWYWQEYGTAVRGDVGRASGHTFDIRPVDKKSLVFPGKNGDIVMTGAVIGHPGIPPTRSVTSAMEPIRESAAKNIDRSFKSGGSDNPSIVRDAVVESTNAAKQEIVKSMAQRLPGTRAGGDGVSPGKLGGATAASVFDSESTVVDLSN